MPRQEARRWVVRGRVQGVGYRFFAQHRATTLGLSGWARNLDDGTVEVYASGSAEKLNDLAAALHNGPGGADVRSVDEQSETVQQLSGFTIR